MVVYEVDPRESHAWETVGAAVGVAARRKHLVNLHAVALVAPRSVPNTSSGKIQRQACKAAFLAASLDTVWEWRAPGPQTAVRSAKYVEDDQD